MPGPVTRFGITPPILKGIAIGIAFLAICLGGHARAQKTETITKANWQQHPKITEIRQITQSVDAGMRKATFRTSLRKFEYCESYADSLRRLTVDTRNVVRRYEVQGGSEDSALTFQHYYDESGRLRFVFITGGAVNGARIEHRIYFDEHGKRLWESHKQVSGPGYPGFSDYPDERLSISRPAKDFAAPSPCLEIKAKGGRPIQ